MTPEALAAEFAAAASTVRSETIVKAMDAAGGIVDDWMRITPSGSGYQGAGFTGSPGANKTAVIQDDGVGAEAYNQSFVATFLQQGTPNMSPKVDFLGAAEKHIEDWVDDMADVADL